MIIQGSNEPITITFTDTVEATKLEISLFNKEEELKHWSKDDLTISDKTVKAPLTEAETLAFPVGSATIEVKWLDSDGYIKFGKQVPVSIVYRNDKTVMG